MRETSAERLERGCRIREETSKRLSNDQENDSALTSDMVLAARERWSHFPGHGWVLLLSRMRANFSRDVDRGWSAAVLLQPQTSSVIRLVFEKERVPGGWKVRSPTKRSPCSLMNLLMATIAFSRLSL